MPQQASDELSGSPIDTLEQRQLDELSSPSKLSVSFEELERIPEKYYPGKALAADEHEAGKEIDPFEIGSSIFGGREGGRQSESLTPENVGYLSSSPIGKNKSTSATTGQRLSESKQSRGHAFSSLAGVPSLTNQQPLRSTKPSGLFSYSNALSLSSNNGSQKKSGKKMKRADGRITAADIFGDFSSH